MSQLSTISRMRAFRACARYHHLGYNEQWESVDADEGAANAFGSSGHLALEEWWHALAAGLSGEQTLAACLDCIDRHPEIRSTLTPHARESLRATITGYHLRWYEKSLRYEVLHVEVQFRVALRNPVTGRPMRGWEQGGKMDVVVRDRDDGRVYVIEHKFSGEDVSPASPYWQRLRVDGQISIYLDGAASLGFEVAGCIYDVIARPAQRPRKATPIESRRYTQGKGCKDCGGSAGGKRGVVQGDGRYHGPPPEDYETTAAMETPVFCSGCQGSGWIDAPRLDARQRETDETPEEYGARVAESIAEDPNHYFGRGDVIRFDEELEDARLDVWETTQAIRDAIRTGRHPRNTDACTRLYGRPCPFLSVCSREASLDDPSKFRRREHAHPELAAI
jgi:hypothetical protein